MTCHQRTDVSLPASPTLHSVRLRLLLLLLLPFYDTSCSVPLLQRPPPPLSVPAGLFTPAALRNDEAAAASEPAF